MNFYKSEPQASLSTIVKSYWAIENDDTSPFQQKIIPDGYPELIFHFGDPYKIDIQGAWEVQKKDILAGQITHYFHLENTGRTAMFAIKFQPWAVHELFGFDMKSLTNQAINLNKDQTQKLLEIKKIARSRSPFDEKISLIEQLLLKKQKILNPLYSVVQDMIFHKGDISLAELLESNEVSERQLERYFSSHIGLSPKRFLRILRFANIFKLVEDGQMNWTEISYHGGYYDQSHFIKNFKEFTGEDPSKYGFDEKNMANFFLK